MISDDLTIHIMLYELAEAMNVLELHEQQYYPSARSPGTIRQYWVDHSVPEVIR